MVDFEKISVRTDGTATVLFDEQCLDIFNCERPAILGNAGASTRHSCAGHKANSLWIGLFPSREYFVGLVWIGCLPLRVGLSVVRRIFGSAISCPFGLQTWPLAQEFAAPAVRAIDADAVRDKTSIMAKFAQRSSGVMETTSGSRFSPIRVIRTPRDASERIFDGADRAQTVGSISFGNVTILARLARFVKSSAAQLRGLSFRYSSHGAPVSNILIAVGA